MRHLFFIPLALLVGGSAGAQSPEPPADPALVAAARQACTARLTQDVAFRDPESVRVGSIERKGTAYIQRLGARARGYVMRVNARNGFGGFTGEREFICFTDAADETRALRVEPDPFGGRP